MKKFIVIMMSILLVVLLLDIGETQAGRRRSGSRGGAWSRYEANYDYVCPAPNSLGPHGHSHYNLRRRNYDRYDDDWGLYFRMAPYSERFGMSRRHGRYGNFGKHHRFYAPGRGKHRRGGRHRR